MFFFLRATALVLAVMLVSGQLINSSPVNAAPPQALTSSFENFLQVRATVSGKGALVEWQTGLEPNTLGFNIFRIKNGQRTQLNAGLIAGPALVARGRAQSYSWLDKQGTIDAVYEVESIDLKGESVARTTAPAVWRASLPEFRQAELLANLGGSTPTSAAQSDWPDAGESKANSETAASFSGESLADQWAIANQSALKIGIRADGWYHITKSQIADAGFNTTGDARNLRLFVGGTEIAMRVSRETGALGSGDFIEFWGQGLDTPTTDTQVYWLVNGTQPGLRVTTKGEIKTDEPPPIEPVKPPIQQDSPITWLLTYPFEIGRAVSPAPNEQRRESTPVRVEEVSKRSDSPLTWPYSYEPRSPNSPEGNTGGGSVMKSPAAPAANKPEPGPAEMSILASKSIEPARRVKASVTRTALRSKKSRTRRNPARSRRRHNHSTQAGATAPAFTYSLQVQDRNVYYSAALNGERENFFGPVLFGDGPVVTVTVHNLETTSAAPAQLQVALQGVSFEVHQVKVFVNGSLAGQISFPDETSANQTFPIPTSWLVEGDNAVKLAPVGSSHDTSVMEFMRLTYPHSFRAENDALQFSVRANQNPTIDGFTTADLRVLDITDPAATQEIRPAVVPSAGGFAARIPGFGAGKARRMVALPATRLSQAAWLALNQPSTLNRRSNAANFVIISHKDFIASLATLVAQRQAQGYTVAVVNVEDVFDEFGYGRHTPQAIRDFMSLAKTTWAQPPQYLLLVGDASYDPRNYMSVGSYDFVPSKQVDTGTESTATALETASDDWFTDFDNDGIADISVGRLPVRTAAEASLMVSKTVNYLPGNTPQSALLVAHNQAGYPFDFDTANDKVGDLLPSTMAIQKVYSPQPSTPQSDALMRANIISKFNSGQAVAVYSGHGNVNIWAGSIFTSNDAAALNNGNRLPFVVVMDCLNGFFADPSLLSLSEAFLQAPNGGAVASFASSGLTIPDGQHQMGLRMFQLLYSGASIPIGDASRLAKAATIDRDVRRTWILLGDPTLKIR